MSTYDLYKTKRLTVTIGKDKINKMNIIAKAKGYKFTSKFYNDIVNKIIDEYEAENGEIIITSE